MGLIEYLRRKLSAEDLALLGAEIEGPGEEDYDAVIRRVAAGFRKHEERFRFARSRLELRYKDLLELPQGRRATILRNSSPVLLLVLFRHLIEESFEERFGDLSRSLKLAAIAVEVAREIAASGYLPFRDSEDVLGEAYTYLGNARRLNSDLAGADRALAQAGRRLAAGTGDREVKAEFSGILAVLRITQGRGVEAARLMDRGLAIRRLLGDAEKLGFALVQRGWIGSLIGEPISQVVHYFQAATPLVNDHKLALQSVHSLAEFLAREGKGIDALESLGAGLLPLAFADSQRLYTQHHWIKGITYRVLGDLERAEKELLDVRAELAASEASYLTAIVSLDLASVYAAQRDFDKARQLAEDAYTIFKAEGLEERALTAVLVLQEAAEAERVTEGLAVAVANFLARFPYNKALRFEWKGE